MKQLILTQQAKTLTANLPNFQKTVKAYQEEIVMRPFESEDLTKAMIQALQSYQQRDLSHIPPHLPRPPEESQEQFVERLYQSHIGA